MEPPWGQVRPRSLKSHAHPPKNLLEVKPNPHILNSLQAHPRETKTRKNKFFEKVKKQQNTQKQKTENTTEEEHWEQRGTGKQQKRHHNTNDSRPKRMHNVQNKSKPNDIRPKQMLNDQNKSKTHDSNPKRNLNV